jgi:hypothetical protein
MWRRISLLALTAVSAVASAATLLDETTTVVDPAAPTAVVRQFDITTAGAHDLTVTDFAVPAPLTDVRAALFQDGTLVKRLDLPANTTTGTVSFDATAGTYLLSIVGTPGTPGIGTLGASVKQGTAPAELDVSQTIQVPNPPPPDTHATLDTSFDIADAGDYRVSLVDMGFPVALSSVRLTIVQQGGSSLSAMLNAAGTATFTATPGTYRLFAIADADPGTKGGVFYTAVRSVATDAPIYRRMMLVGQVEQLGGGMLDAGEHTLVGSDLKLPVPLTALHLAVTSEGVLVSRLDAEGNATFTAVAGAHEFLAAAQPATGNAGSYAAEVRHGTTPDFSFVNTTSDGSAGAVTLSGNITTAGTYRLRLSDFAFPQAFTGLRATVTQAGAVSGSLNAPGSLDVDLVAGAVKVLVFGQAGSSANGIFGVNLSMGTAAPVIEATRGVGTAFAARQFNVATEGRYQVTADDLEFPEQFAGLDAVITRGPDVIGSFFGGGSFVFSATPGSYFINFIAKPGATSGGAGTFRMRVTDAPSLPTVTMTALPTKINVGESARIDWSSTNATACTASGAWSGSKAATGNEVIGSLTTQSTFNLECTGPGGSATAKVTVDVSSQSGNGGGGGGGGALSETMLLVLAAAAALRALSARARPVRRR